jgi:hypothetical protein
MFGVRGHDELKATVEAKLEIMTDVKDVTILYEDTTTLVSTELQLINQLENPLSK